MDVQTDILEYETGASLAFHANLNVPDEHRRSCVMGAHGMAEGDFVRGFLRISRRDGSRHAGHDHTGDASRGAHHGADDLMVCDVAAHLRGEAGSLSVGVLGAMEAGIAAMDLDQGRADGPVVDIGETWARLDAFAGAGSVFVVGRDCGLGAAGEVALKLKEVCALHAEALSASEVLHGPVQLASQGLLALVLDTGHPPARESLDLAQRRLGDSGAVVHRVSPADVGTVEGGEGLTPAAAAALLLCLLYPVVREVALRRGQDPDSPSHLSKVTRTT